MKKKRYVSTCCLVTLNVFYFHFPMKVFKWMYLHKIFLSYACHIHYHTILLIYYKVRRLCKPLDIWHIFRLKHMSQNCRLLKAKGKLIHEDNDSRWIYKNEKYICLFIEVKSTIYDSTVLLFSSISCKF